MDFIKAKEEFKNYLKDYDAENSSVKLKIVHTYHVVDFSQYKFSEAIDMEIPFPEFGGYGDQSYKNTPPIHVDLTGVEALQNVIEGEQLVIKLVPYQCTNRTSGVVAFTSKDLPERFIEKGMIISGVIE